MSKKSVHVGIRGKTLNGYKTDIKNGYPLPAGTDIFYARMLTGQVRVS